MSVSAGITLARALVAAKPVGLSPGVDRAAGTLEEVADAAQEALALRHRLAAAEGDESTRVVDTDADISWSVMRMRIEAIALLPDSFGKARRARNLLQTLFGDDGLVFLRERYPVQFTLADTLLKRIDDEGLQAEIDSLAGAEFLANIRVQHERYRGMVQGIMMRAQATEENLHDHIRRLQRAITDYAIQVCATVENDKPATAERARAALLPIANFRQQSLRRATSTADTGDDRPGDDQPGDTAATTGAGARTGEPGPDEQT